MTKDELKMIIEKSDFYGEYTQCEPAYANEFDKALNKLTDAIHRKFYDNRREMIDMQTGLRHDVVILKECKR